jgi:hypothetical protein
MPIYEYYCPQNHTIYQFLARTLAHRDVVPRCPDNPHFTLEKRVSRFAVIGRAKEENADDPFAGMEDAKLEGLMNEMEGEMAALDSDNPDPRQLGRFMRKLTEVMGDKTPAELREVVRRLEAGEDPEKLESEFGALEDGAEGSSEALFGQVRRILHASKQPQRDPHLYELRDWLP